MKPQNNSEEELLDTLIDLKGERIELSLHPQSGRTISRKAENICYISEGRKGKFENISEAFYDWCVDKFDSRVNH